MKARDILVFLIVFCIACGVKTLTIREVIETKLESGPDPTSWASDMALASVIYGPRYEISDEEAEVLHDVLRFVPRSPPSPIFSILEERKAFDVDAILDLDIYDIIKGIKDHLLDCVKLRDGDTHSYAATQSLTEEKSNNSECLKDLTPLLAPIPNLLIDYVESAMKQTADAIKGPINRCRITINQGSKILLGCKTKRHSFPDWTIPIVDAMAKPPTGIMGGQLQWVGSYEMCNKIDTSYDIIFNDTHNETRPFRGKYCRVMLGPVNSTSALLRLGFGLCLPDTCSTSDVMDHLVENPGLIGRVLGLVNLEIKEVFCGHELDYDTDTRAQVAITISIILLVIAICASLYDGLIRTSLLQSWVESDELFAPTTDMLSNGGANIHQSELRRQSSQASNIGLISTLSINGKHKLHDEPSILWRLESAFAGFSVLTSFRRICDVTHLGKHHMASADTIRFLSLAYAIGGNTFLFGIIYTESITSSNLLAKMKELPHVLLFQPIVNFAFTADSFLVVSGVMVAYHWLRRVKKSEKSWSIKQILFFYIHRYWSLMPMMMLTIMIYACLYKYLVSGPIIPPQITDAENCKVNWWTNLLLLGNLVKTDQSCLAWTWYAPMLFQLQIISPIILVPLSIKRWLGWLVLAIFYVIYLSTVSGVVNEQVYNPSFDFATWYYDYLLTPWCRAGPYFIGMAVGIILSEREKIKEKVPKNIITKAIALVIWIGAILVVMGLTFGSYSKNKKEDPRKWTRDESVAHDTLARSTWGLAIGWMILACETGFGGVINSILSYGCFTPVSRLSYPVFIIHAIFIFKYAYSQFDTLYITFPLMLYVYFGHIILIYMIGFLAALLFYYPFRGIELAFRAKTNLDIALAASHPDELKSLRGHDLDDLPEKINDSGFPPENLQSTGF